MSLQPNAHIYMHINNGIDVSVHTRVSICTCVSSPTFILEHEPPTAKGGLYMTSEFSAL